MDNPNNKARLNWRLPDHESPLGKSLSDRNQPLAANVEAASEAGLWQYFRQHVGPVGLNVTVQDEAGRQWTGLNLASQDYLGLATDKRVAAAAIAAIERYGVHSSGSAPMGGGSVVGQQLADRLSEITGLSKTLLFPTGWAAGYGAIRGLVRPHDHVVIDALAHNCLQHGAASATDNVHPFSHNSLESLEKRLRRIRDKDPDAAILVVTEGLFSMDSDSPDLEEVVTLKDRFEAYLCVDIAHDFGVLGPTGRGALEGELFKGVDAVVGSFSKTFASIGGFVSFRDVASLRAVQGFSGSYTFSNYLIPPQLGAVSSALDIAFSEEGQIRRAKVASNAAFLRQALIEHGIETTGRISPMVIVVVGDEMHARSAYRELLANEIILNCIEFPAVRRGAARFRIQLTPEHRRSDLQRAADAIASAINSTATPRPA